VFNLVELCGQQPAVPADRAASAQRLDPACPPGAIPAVRALAGDTEPERDRRRGHALDEQVGSSQPTAL
jgi:hypothetical protein